MLNRTCFFELERDAFKVKPLLAEKSWGCVVSQRRGGIPSLEAVHLCQ
jgi:hypothetical protein